MLGIEVPSDVADDLEAEAGFAHARTRSEDVEAARTQRHQLVVEVADAGLDADLGVVLPLDDLVEGLVGHLIDSEDLRRAVELPEFENGLAAFIDELGKLIGSAVGLVAQGLQALDQLALEVVVLEQRDIAIEASKRSEGLGQVTECAVAADGRKRAVLVRFGTITGHLPPQITQTVTTEGIKLLGLEQQHLLLELVEHRLEAVARQQFSHRLQVDRMIAVVELQAGEVDDAVIALEERQRVFDHRAHLLHRDGIATIEQRRQHRPFEIQIMRQLPRRRQVGLARCGADIVGHRDGILGRAEAGLTRLFDRVVKNRWVSHQTNRLPGFFLFLS